MIKPALTTAATATAVLLGIAGAPAAAADAELQYLGQPGELVNGTVVQAWTVTDLRPSTDTIPYPVAGRLWEATATDEAVSGAVTPIVSNLNARARSGQTYRVLFGVATPQGVNPATLEQGETTAGKIYFDVTGDEPDSVVYNAGGTDLLVWVQAPPPPPATGSTGGYASSAPAGTQLPAESSATETPAPPADAEAAAPAVPEGSSGTPLPEGSTGTPLPEGSTGTAVPDEAAPAPAAASPAPAGPAAEGSAGTPLPEGSAGTPLPEGSTGTPLPADAAAPATTTVMPAPPA